jgi:hypothetical protein
LPNQANTIQLQGINEAVSQIPRVINKLGCADSFSDIDDGGDVNHNIQENCERNGMSSLV